MTGWPARADIEDFLYLEAALLDEWRLDEWLALWTDPARYIIPATDAPDGDPRSALALVADDLPLLRSRVRQLLDGTAWAEVPRSRTRRSIANVRIVSHEGTLLTAASNFVVYRSRRDRTETFAGSYVHVLAVTKPSFRIHEKRAVLVDNTLSAQGKISILL